MGLTLGVRRGWKRERGTSGRWQPSLCTPWLGPYAAAQPFNGKELLSVSGLPLIPSWEEFLGRRMSSPNLVHYFSNEKPVR